MRVAVVSATTGTLSGGYRKYMVEFLPALRREPSIESLDVYVPRGTDMAATEGAHVFSPADGWQGFRALRRDVQSRAPDVAVVPTARAIDLHPIPTVVMARNMEPLVQPLRGQSALAIIKNLARLASARRAVRNAARVIATSNFVRDTLIQRWKIAPQKIGVVYHGVTAPPAGYARRPIVLESVRRPFLFTAGSIRPARGLEDVIVALALLRDRGMRHRLVIAGSAVADSRGYEGRMRALVRRLNLDDDVVWAGQLASEEMSWAFEAAELFVMTSRTEACPNVVLEALAHGCVSISTDAAPMPEFYRDSALYYCAPDSHSLSAAIERALALPAAERQAFGARAAARSLEFTWAKTARRTVEELLQATIDAQPTAVRFSGRHAR